MLQNYVHVKSTGWKPPRFYKMNRTCLKIVTFGCRPLVVSIICGCPELILVVPGERTTTISIAACKVMSTGRCCKKQHLWLIFIQSIVIWFVLRWHLCHHWSESNPICIPRFCVTHCLNSSIPRNFAKSVASSKSSKFWVSSVSMFKATSSKLFD